MADDTEGMLLGKSTPLVEECAPELLFPIPRSSARAKLCIGAELPFYGADLWHAYEISWLDPGGKPQVRVGRFSVPASSPNMVESKSFKLYLNSLNHSRFDSEEAAHAVMVADISEAAGAEVSLELVPVDDASLAGIALAGECLDDLQLEVEDIEPDGSLLQTGEGVESGQFYSHLLRSLCPVTAQPDWATVWFSYRGPRILRESLLRYIIAFRRHQEFHEQCVERMFTDLQRRLSPEFLEIQAFYTRRGGLDISPFRSTDQQSAPRPRLNRQ